MTMKHRFRWPVLVYVASSLLLFVPKKPVIVGGHGIATSTKVGHDPRPWQSVFGDVNYTLDDDKTPSVVLLSQRPWHLFSTDGVYSNIPAGVPGDVLTDLSRAGILPDDLYYDRNIWIHRRVWMGPVAEGNSGWNGTKRILERRTRVWEYTLGGLELPNWNVKQLHAKLVVEGVKMGSMVFWDGVQIGPNLTNQFRRYEIAIPSESLALQRSHRISLRFDPTIPTEGRFAACSGGWDWAPYAWEADEKGSRVLSFGIIKDLYIVPYEKLLITDVVPEVYYRGPYPREPLVNGPEGNFEVKVTVHLEFSMDDRHSGLDGYGLLYKSNFTDNTGLFDLGGHANDTVDLHLTASNDVKLWWPLGMGNQTLYSLQTALSYNGSQLGPWIQRRIGFRTLALVTANDTDDSVLADMLDNDVEGSGSHGMFFRINGASLWSRGANAIPMDQLEGRVTEEAARRMVESAAQANMNTLRVWGGGSIMPRSFYDACDELGVMLYHDLMFVEEQNHGAEESENIKDEIKHIVRQLMAHPSIILWNGCNECGYAKRDLSVYYSFVMKTVGETDGTRPIWPSSPAKFGWSKGVHMLNGLPNGRELKLEEHGHRAIEAHGPYVRGFANEYGAVNGNEAQNSFETLVPAEFSRSRDRPIGVSQENAFISEFGASVYSSFESMSPTIPETSWSVHGNGTANACVPTRPPTENVCNGTNTMAERNYPCDSRLESYFGQVDLNKRGEISFREQLYLSMIAHALWLSGRIAMMRAHNYFGTLIWQLNENWPTGGWGSIEYGPKRGIPGQVMGGRWKPLMYILQRSVYKDISVACGKGDLCYVINDSLGAAEGRVGVEAWNLAGDKPIRSHDIPFSIEGMRGLKYFELPKGFTDEADVVLYGVSGAQADEAYLWSPPKDLSGLSRVPSIHTRVVLDSSENASTVSIEVSTDGLVLYVWLSTIAEGSFSENAFHLRPGLKKVEFTALPGCTVDTSSLQETLIVNHLGTHRTTIPMTEMSSTWALG